MADPIQPEYYEMLNGLARGIDQILNGESGAKDVGFALLMFPFGDKPDGRVNYISNAEREDMLAAMKEFIARAEGRYIEKEKGEVN